MARLRCQEAGSGLEDRGCAVDAHIAMERRVVFPCILLHCCMAMGRL